MRRTVLAAIGVFAALVLASCGDDDTASDDVADTVVGDDAVMVVTETALENLVVDLITAFNQDDDGVEVELSIVEGDAAIQEAASEGGADVVIAPDDWIEQDAETLGRTLAVIAVPVGNPDDQGLDAFAADSSATTVICGDESPLGNLSAAVLADAGVSPDPATIEEGCEDEALSRVAEGDVDAALVFRAGLEIPEGVELIEVDAEHNVIIDIVAASVGPSDGAAAFTEFLTSEAARDILQDRGYLP